MQKNVSGQKIGAQMVTASDGSAFSGSVTVEVTIDAGTQATGTVGSGACTHEGNGYHTYAPSQAETNGALLAFTFHGTGAIPATVQVFTTGYDKTQTAIPATVAGAVGSVTGNVGGNVVGSVASVSAAVSVTGDLSATMKTSVGAAVTSAVTALEPIAANVTQVDGTATASLAELSAPPAVASVGLLAMLRWMYHVLRNKQTVTATQRKRYKNDGSTVLSTETLSDDGTTFTDGAAS